MSLSRRQRNKWVRKVLLIALCVITFIDFIRFHTLHFSQPQSQLSSQGLQRAGSQKSKGNQRVFIASTHWNNEAILRSHWNAAVVELVQYFGVNNTFVSIYESGSWDNSKDALRGLGHELDALGVRNKIVLDETTHLDELARGPPVGEDKVGWVETPRSIAAGEGKRELRRIPYLSRLRNESLKPLEELAKVDSHTTGEGVYFDKILFLNDVVFTLNDVLALLDTNDGQYAAACSLDFSKAPNYYDTFALRDSEGHEAVMSTWPYFRSHASRTAIKHGDPVPVKSCWNGMVWMPADPFYGIRSSSAVTIPVGDTERAIQQSLLGREDKLRFRGISDDLALSHLEGSECCLIHKDNPLSEKRGVFVNPHVRVGYNKPAYDAMNESGSGLSLGTYLYRSWQNRVLRWVTTDWFKVRVVRRRIQDWEQRGTHNYEPGLDCLVNEMQVLVGNGWAHV